MSRSIDAMCLLFHTGGEAILCLAFIPIVTMSLQPAIPWRVALQQSSPPLRRPDLFSTDQLKL
jgi:hypothetical protein